MSTRKDPRCKKCGGQFSAGGYSTRKIPTGFVFAGSNGRFQVDAIEIKAYIGFCMKCGSEEPVEFSRRRVTMYPASINRKIKAARGGTT